MPTAGSESIIIKVKQEYFSLKRDLCIIFSYCVPQGSSFQTRTQFDPFDDIENKLRGCGSDVDFMCLGDYNARTGCRLDYLTNEDNEDIPFMSDMVNIDTSSCFPRGNIDNTNNKYGDRLLVLCQTVPLRICNGRKLGDILGSNTCFTWNGKSAVDYCLASPNIFDKIMSFQVMSLNPTLSDHCPISVSLSVNMSLIPNKQIIFNLVPFQKKLNGIQIFQSDLKISFNL